MGKTTRSYPQTYYKLHGNLYYENDYSSFEWERIRDMLWASEAKHLEDFELKDGRDRKPWFKPHRLFKRIKRQAEKAKVKQAVHRMSRDPEGDVVIPDFPNTDVWDWS